MMQFNEVREKLKRDIEVLHPDVMTESPYVEESFVLRADELEPEIQSQIKNTDDDVLVTDFIYRGVVGYIIQDIKIGIVMGYGLILDDGKFEPGGAM